MRIKPTKKTIELLFWIIFHVGFTMVPVLAVRAFGIPKHSAWVMPTIALQGLVQGILLAIRMKSTTKPPKPNQGLPDPSGDYILEAHKALKKLGLIPKEIDDQQDTLENGRWTSDQIAHKLVHSLPMELQVAMIAGCEYELGRQGDNISVIMRYPVAVRRIGELFEIRELTERGENIRFLDKKLKKIYIA